MAQPNFDLQEFLRRLESDLARKKAQEPLSPTTPAMPLAPPAFVGPQLPASTLPPTPTPDTLKAVTDYAMTPQRTYAQTQTDIAPSQELTETFKEPKEKKPAPKRRFRPDDFWRRYKAASQEERNALRKAGTAKALSQAISTMLTTPAHIMTGTPPPQVSTAPAEAEVQAARMEKSDLEMLEMIDPNSLRSRHMQEYIKGQFPELAGQMNIEDMGASQILQMMPWVERAEDRKWKEREYALNREARLRQAEATLEQTKYYREARLSLARDAAKRAGFKMTRLPEGGLKDVKDYTATLKDIDRIKDLYEKDLGHIIGPIQGRVQSFMIKVGMAEPDVAVTNANIIGMMAEYIKHISGVAVAEPEFRRLFPVAPNIVQNPRQFKATLDNFEKMVKDKYRASLQTYGRSGYNITPHLLEEDEINFDEETGSLSIIPGEVESGVHFEHNGRSGRMPEEQWKLYKKEFPEAKRIKE